MPDTLSRPVIRFGVFELDLRSGELRRGGAKVKLQEQPFQILAMLLERPGEIVSREEIQKKLWSEDTFVDFEHSVATTIKRLREALGDSADNPRFVETLPRRGYRFIAPVDSYQPQHRPRIPSSERRGVETDSPTLAPLLRGREAEEVPVPQPSPSGRGWFRWAEPGEGSRRIRFLAAGGALVAVTAVLMAFNVAGLRERLATLLGAQRLSPPPEIHSIAVLPLENLSRDPEQEYFADGMTDELIATLAKIGSLRVISRTSVMRYKGNKKPLPEIARELNVDAVVEGSVLRSGDRVRITANLLHAPSDRHLWAETYERDLRDVLRLQDEVAQDITSGIKIRVTPQERARLAGARPVDPEVYRLYLQGRYHLCRQVPGEIDKSISLFQQALEKDPDNALAWAGLADSYGALVFYRPTSPKDEFAKAKAAALRALEIDNSLAEAHSALGRVLIAWDRDWSAAERELKHAIELKPSYAEAHRSYSWYLMAMGRTEQGIAEMRLAEELDPLSPGMLVMGSHRYRDAHRYHESIEQGRKALELDSNYGPAHHAIGLTYIIKGMPKEAMTELETATRLGTPYGLDVKALAYAAAGRRDEVRKLVNPVRELTRRGQMTPFALVQFYVALGDKQTALDWLEKACDQRDPYTVMLKVNPFLDPLRSDSRFQELLHRMNLPP
jgi:TolB-like protein/DNA-binding winged helix-turn-helix (wHTH) protein/tetratricopeptide (TPR) repeat protein